MNIDHPIVFTIDQIMNKVSCFGCCGDIALRNNRIYGIWQQMPKNIKGRNAAAPLEKPSPIITIKVRKRSRTGPKKPKGKKQTEQMEKKVRSRFENRMVAIRGMPMHIA